MLQEERIFARHIGKTLLLDSNLLLVFLAGSLDRRLFGSFKRISAYSIEDYELLERFVGKFSILLTTPHILTEVSNLANSLTEQWRQAWFQYMARFVSLQGSLPEVGEHWVSAKALVSCPEFVLFGLTDTALTRIPSGALILTDDFRLSGFLRERGVSILNFRDLRSIQHSLHAIAR